MLKPSFLGKVADKAVELFERLNLFAVRGIARRIADAENHMTASADYQAWLLVQAGKSLDEIKAETAAILHESEDVVAGIFEEAVLTSYDNDAAIFADAGVETAPFETEQSRKFIQVFYEQTNGELYNYTQTTAEESQTAFIDACSNAMAKVRAGLESPEQAVREAIEETAKAGLYVSYPTGHIDTIEVAVRRAVMTGVNQASLQMTIDECDRLGTNLVIVSSHLGARVSDVDPHANHAGWQGGVYRIANRLNDFYGPLEHLNAQYSGHSYEYLEDATGYPSDPLGLGGYNCRHSMYPYVPGVSENHMQEFDETENRKAYEASQRQRGMERAMRSERRQIEALKEAYSVNPSKEIDKALGSHKAKYRYMRQEYEAFCEANGLTPQLNRIYTAS